MLNFDPHRWLEEHQEVPEISSLATLAATHPKTGKQGNEWKLFDSNSLDENGEKRELEGDPAKVARPAKVVLREWSVSLAALDGGKPSPGIDRKVWRELIECSLWWLDGFGQQAARDGWRTGDVFGFRLDHPRQGGLIDRLGTARNLLLDGKRARWRSHGDLVMKFNAGAYPELPAFWEAD
ncbi:hypothetical protein [uncultured Erythrobacter sp.]|uniref:hypothetical protein n=1 Tax=uncultured Erythrobacter sp. TaxID=263913 RepID=UPI00261F57BB|nr:hypothetical protein [uncultured Erythrobacter sp.]